MMKRLILLNCFLMGYNKMEDYKKTCHTCKHGPRDTKYLCSARPGCPGSPIPPEYWEPQNRIERGQAEEIDFGKLT